MISEFEGFVPAIPSLIVTGTSGNVKVVRKLYGLVTKERAEFEHQDVFRRAGMLNPATFEKPREIDWREDL